ncbi:MAG TPA: hypothetical protein DEH78_17910 [Solibacterales bacterium]|nr:hypothetical protein [Bryobacterales bacterium]
MRNQKRQPADNRFGSGAPPAPRRKGPGFVWKRWHSALLIAGLVLLMLEVYSPALRGPMVFDDGYLVPGFTTRTLPAMFTGLRPLTYASLYFNNAQSGLETYSYHLWNVLLHVAAGLVAFRIVRRLLVLAGPSAAPAWLVAAFSAGVFLLHPLQTEGVAYITSRSEVLSVFFAYAALAAFLKQEEAGISLARSLGVLFLFGLGFLSKEHAAVLPAALIAANYYWFPGFSFAGFRRNWRLYVLMAIGAAAGGALVLRVLLAADTAGFGLKDLPWHHYFWTQCRAIWVYLRLFVVPVGQSVDHEFALSRGPFDHLAALALLALIALAAAAWIYRRRFPLASFGIFLFLILVAPTSSVVPIRDLLVERRFYLPSIGAILVAAEFVRRWRGSLPAQIAVLGGVLVFLGVAAHSRNAVWGSDLALWQDALAQAPQKARPNEQVAFALYQLGQCKESLPYFEKAVQMNPQGVTAMVNWSSALDCAGSTEAALPVALKAAAIDQTGNSFASLSVLYGKLGRTEEALKAADRSIAIDPGNDTAFFNRGNIHRLANQPEKAAADYRRALEINPRNEAAQQGLSALAGDANRR